MTRIAGVSWVWYALIAIAMSMSQSLLEARVPLAAGPHSAGAEAAPGSPKASETATAPRCPEERSAGSEPGRFESRAYSPFRGHASYGPALPLPRSRRQMCCSRRRLTRCCTRLA